MEKTKFIRVAVDERLPDEELLSVLTNIGKLFVFDVEKSAKWWLDEIPDREDEMLQMLERCKKSLDYVYENCIPPILTNDSETEDQIESILYTRQEIESLIQSVKQTK